MADHSSYPKLPPLPGGLAPLEYLQSNHRRGSITDPSLHASTSATPSLGSARQPTYYPKPSPGFIFPRREPNIGMSHSPTDASSASSSARHDSEPSNGRNLTSMRDIPHAFQTIVNPDGVDPPETNNSSRPLPSVLDDSEDFGFSMRRHSSLNVSRIRSRETSPPPSDNIIVDHTHPQGTAPNNLRSPHHPSPFMPPPLTLTQNHSGQKRKMSSDRAVIFSGGGGGFPDDISVNGTGQYLSSPSPLSGGGTSTSTADLDTQAPPSKRRSSGFDSRISHLSLYERERERERERRGSVDSRSSIGGQSPAWQHDRRDSSASIYSSSQSLSSASMTGSFTPASSTYSSSDGKVNGAPSYGWSPSPTQGQHGVHVDPSKHGGAGGSRSFYSSPVSSSTEMTSFYNPDGTTTTQSPTIQSHPSPSPATGNENHVVPSFPPAAAISTLALTPRRRLSVSDVVISKNRRAKKQMGGSTTRSAPPPPPPLPPSLGDASTASQPTSSSNGSLTPEMNVDGLGLGAVRTPITTTTTTTARRKPGSSSAGRSVSMSENDNDGDGDGDRDGDGDGFDASMIEGGQSLSDSKDSPYSRSPELRVSHKLAERKRRKEMKELFDELRDQLPADRGMKASKWEILSKAVDYIGTLKSAFGDLSAEVEKLRQEAAIHRSNVIHVSIPQIPQQQPQPQPQQEASSPSHSHPHPRPHSHSHQAQGYVAVAAAAQQYAAHAQAQQQQQQHQLHYQSNGPQGQQQDQPQQQNTTMAGYDQ